MIPSRRREGAFALKLLLCLTSCIVGPERRNTGGLLHDPCTGVGQCKVGACVNAGTGEDFSSERSEFLSFTCEIRCTDKAQCPADSDCVSLNPHRGFMTCVENAWLLEDVKRLGVLKE